MKIHIFINCFWEGAISGGDRRILELMRRWKNCKEYSFIVYTTARFHELMTREGIIHLRVIEIDEGRKKKENIILEYWHRTKSCIQIMKEYVSDGDIFYSPTDILPDVLPAVFFVMKRGHNYKWVMMTFHVFEKFYKRSGSLINNFLSCYQQKLAMHLGNKYAHTYLTTSPIVVDYMKRKRFRMDKVVLVGNAVDTDIIEKANMNIQGYDAVFLARLNYSKGIFELPVIWKKVTAQFPNARLALMGKGTNRITAELQECVKENHMEKHIELMGYVDAERAYSIMKKSKLFLFTSHEEGWGMALAEALVCGIPVVAYNLPIFPKLFKKGVILCEFKNMDEMAHQVCVLLSDETERETCGLEGRQYILDHYSLDRVAREELNQILK